MGTSLSIRGRVIGFVLLLRVTLGRVCGVATIGSLGLVGRRVIVRVRVAHGDEAYYSPSTATIIVAIKRDVINIARDSGSEFKVATGATKVR